MVHTHLSEIKTTARLDLIKKSLACRIFQPISPAFTIRMIEKYYRILGIPVGSDEDAIKRAYRQLALKIHPDVNDSPDAKQKFQELCEAYEVLISQHNKIHSFDSNSNSEPGEDSVSWEEIIRQANTRARQRAQIRYEKLKAEQDLFEKSGWKDIIIIMKYFGSITGFIGGLWLVGWPLYYILTKGLYNVFALFFFLTTGIILLVHILKNPAKWFLHGKPDLHLYDLIDYFDFSKYEDVNTPCAYCKGHMGRGRPFRLTMLKVRGIQMKNEGVGQHYARYKRVYKDLIIPRSRKAFTIHFIITCIKIITLITGLLYIPFPSVIWRFIGAVLLAGLISGIISLTTRTRFKASFLLTPFMILKVVIWILVLLTQTYVYPGFILASTSVSFILVLLMVFFLDMILDLILRIFPFYNRFYFPLPRQLPGIDYLFRKGYQTYLDVPVWSTIYPFFRWLL